METKLRIFLIIICLIFTLFVYRKVEKGSLQLKYSFAWYIVTFFLILAAIFDDLLIPIKNFLGFETISNMIFIFGFLIITMIIFSLNIKISELQLKVTKLTQEIALLKKEMKDNEDD